MTVKPDELTPELFMRLYSVLELRQKLAPDPARAEVLNSLASLRNNVAHAATRTEDVLRELSPMLPELLDYLHLLENSSLGTPFAKSMRVLSTPESINEVLLRSIELEEAEHRRIKKKKKKKASTYAPIRSGDPTSNDTVQAAIAGDRAALEVLLSWMRPLVYKYCSVRLAGRGPVSAEVVNAVTYDICAAIVAALVSKENDEDILPFVYGIAAHHVVQHLRSEKLGAGEAVGDLSGSLSHLLNLLPAKQREVLVLRVVVGLSAEETAQAVGSTPGAVRIAQHRALVNLRKQIARMETPYRFGENVAEF